MEDMVKITLVTVAVMVLIATVAAVGLFSVQQQTVDAQNQVSDFKTDLVNVTKTLQENELKNAESQSRIKQLQNDLQLVTQQNQTLRRQIVQQNTPPADPDEVFENILTDINKLTLQNCPSVLSYAAREERNLREEREDLLDRLHLYERRLAEREADLQAAVAAGNQDRVRTEMERVDYMEDQVDEIREEIDDFDDLEYSNLQHLKSRAESWCRRLERRF